jgi:hypothetical protein
MKFLMIEMIFARIFLFVFVDLLSPGFIPGGKNEHVDRVGLIFYLSGLYMTGG